MSGVYKPSMDSYLYSTTELIYIEFVLHLLAALLDNLSKMIDLSQRITYHRVLCGQDVSRYNNQPGLCLCIYAPIGVPKIASNVFPFLTLAGPLCQM